MNTDPYVVVGETRNFVTDIRLCRPPHNFFSMAMIGELGDVLEALDDDRATRVIVLGAEGKNFCAGADFSGQTEKSDTAGLYQEAVRLFRTRKPIIAALNGAAIGGGLGMALACDFRIATPESRLSANFARLGFHHGFGLTVTLPALVGQQRSAELLFTGRRISGNEALAMGLIDRLVGRDDLISQAHELAGQIAESAPLAVESIRATLRGGLAERVMQATNHEMSEQARLRRTNDFQEGTQAMTERRPPHFMGN